MIPLAVGHNAVARGEEAEAVCDMLRQRTRETVSMGTLEGADEEGGPTKGEELDGGRRWRLTLSET